MLQALALTTACLIVINNARGVERLIVSPSAPRLIITVVVVILYHLAGIRWHAWMMSRPLAAFTFVPAGWVILLIAIADHNAFAVLVFGAILQLLIFLPFVTALVSVAPAIGVMIGTVMLYIHRVNLDAAISRARAANFPRSRFADSEHRESERLNRVPGRPSLATACGSPYSVYTFA